MQRDRPGGERSSDERRLRFRQRSLALSRVRILNDISSMWGSTYDYRHSGVAYWWKIQLNRTCDHLQLRKRQQTKIQFVQAVVPGTEETWKRRGLRRKHDDTDLGVSVQLNKVAIDLICIRKLKRVDTKEECAGHPAVTRGGQINDYNVTCTRNS